MKQLIPEAALHQHIIVLGKTGAGKSSCLRSAFIEPLLDADKPVCIIDPKGDHWGLRLSADGKKPGYPVVIFGGEHADVPIHDRAGAHVAEIVATGNRPCIIDLGDFMVGERTRFFIDFAAALFRHTRGQRWLVIDEVHNFAPQGKVLDVDSGRMLHWANRLAAEGRGRGINIIAASQRPQKIHKDFLTSAETLVAMRVIHPLDRNAIKEWVDGCPDPAKGREVISTLATMPRGEGWVWSPEIGFGPQRIRFPLFRTYDSFRPQTERAEKLAGWTEIDLAEVRARLEQVVKEAEANDPAKLRARIQELERQLAQQKPAAVEKVEVPALRHGEIQELRRLLEIVERGLDSMTSVQHTLEVAATNSKTIAEHIRRTLEQTGQQPTAFAAVLPKQDHRPARAPVASGADSAIGLEKAQQHVLAVLAHYGHVRDGKQLALLCGYGYNGHFRNVLGELRSRGLIAGENTAQIALTDKGAEVASRIPPLPILDKQELRAHWIGKFDKCGRAILDVLLQYPNGVDSKTVCRLTGYGYNGHFRNTLGELRKAGVLIGPNTGTMRPAPELLG